NDAAPAAQRSGHVEISVTVESQALWTAKPAIENARFAALVESHNHFKAGNGWPTHIKRSVRTESQMICRHRRFMLRLRTRFPNPVNPIDGSGAISDEHLVVTIERQTGSNAEAAGEHRSFF